MLDIILALFGLAKRSELESVSKLYHDTNEEKSACENILAAYADEVHGLTAQIETCKKVIEDMKARAHDAYIAENKLLTLHAGHNELLRQYSDRDAEYKLLYNEHAKVLAEAEAYMNDNPPIHVYAVRTLPNRVDLNAHVGTGDSAVVVTLCSRVYNNKNFNELRNVANKFLAAKTA